MSNPQHPTASTVELVGKLLDERSNSLVLYASQWTEEAEDCVQEALIALAQQPEVPHSPVAWLYRVVKHRALNRLRSKKRRQNRESIAWEQRLVHQASTPSQNECHEDRLDLIEALNRIEPDAREVILLHIEAGLSFAMIGEVLEISSSAAHRRYYVALRAMRRHLEPGNPLVAAPNNSSAGSAKAGNSKSGNSKTGKSRGDKSRTSESEIGPPPPQQSSSTRQKKKR